MTTIKVTTTLGFEAAEEALRASLSDQGFGILTEIDLSATLKKKIDVDRPPQKILGACNPHLANQALGIDPDVSVLLPCNVVITETDSGTLMSTADPQGLISNDGLRDFADHVSEKLTAAFDAVAASA